MWTTRVPASARVPTAKSPTSMAVKAVELALTLIEPPSVIPRATWMTFVEAVAAKPFSNDNLAAKALAIFATDCSAVAVTVTVVEPTVKL